MLKSFKYRLYPTLKQQELINKHIGSCRFIYNLALECKLMAWSGSKINLSCYDLIKQLSDLKREYAWLKEINSQSLQQSIKNLDNAYINFFKGSGFPKFKSKHKGKQSFSVIQNVIIKNDKLIIYKFKEGIDIVLHRPIKGKIKQATISKTQTNKYFVSILCETNEIIPIKSNIKENTTIGIDLGIKDFLTTSNGNKVENPKFLKKSISKLKYIQRKYSKKKGKRTKYKLQKLHEKIANQRKDFLHKASNKLISENQTIAIEDLSVKGMLKNHNLSQSITDVSWGIFIDFLKYKANWCGVNILEIGTFEPSSKTCSNCEEINKELILSDRYWICNKCQSYHDRDINAAINIKNIALKNMVSGTDTKNHNELLTLVGVMTYEV